MKGRLPFSIHPYLYQKFREVSGSRQMSQTLENLLRLYNKDHVCETRRGVWDFGWSVHTASSIDSKVLDEFLKPLPTGKKRSLLIQLLIKQYLERLHKL